MRKTISILFLTVSALQLICAQGSNSVDSLKRKLVVTTNDSLKSEIFIQLSVELLNVDNEEGMKYAENAYKIAIENKLFVQQGRALYLKSKFYRASGNLKLELQSILDGIRIFEKHGPEDRVADGYLLVGTYYYNLYITDKAIEYFDNGLEIYKRIKDKTGESFALNNLGSCFQQKGDNENAKVYYNKSLKIDQELDNANGMAGSWVNLGVISMGEKNYDEAEKYFNKALDVYAKVNDIYYVTACLVNLGEIMNIKKDYSSALIYYNTAEEKAKSINNEYLIKTCYYNKALNYDKQGKYKDAFENLYNYVVINDSLSRKDMMEKLAEMAEKYESDKKEKEILLLNEEKKVAEQKNKIQELENIKQKAVLAKTNTILIFSVSGIILLVLFAALLINRNRLKQKANLLLTQQKAEIVEKSQIIEEKNKDILDSILYAKRIQDAILREENKAMATLPEHFIFFRPKDIVSGDFYWTLKKGDHWYFAIVDCTGHGVPGAFMSMLGIAFLNEINSVHQLLSPAEILDELREKIIRELGQNNSESGSMDGMDMSLIRFNSETRSIDYAGAQNPVWVVRNKELIELKPDKQPVSFQSKQTPFTNQSMQLMKNDVIYLFSDGYADQFGGPDIYGRPAGGKKFKYKRLKDMLANAAHIEIPLQKEMLELTFHEWKGDYEQIDDVTLAGIKI